MAHEAMLRLFRISHNRASYCGPLPAIFPGNRAPVVRQAHDGEREQGLMSWGFVLPQAGKAPRRVTNMRDDTALSSPFWRDSFETRCCLAPATSFCEPNEDVKPATWHWFALKGDEPRALFAFPGVWRRHKGPLKKNGDPVELDVFAFMTTTPNSLVAAINHERMPVLLTTDAQFSTWSSGTPQQAIALSREYPSDAMHIVREGFDKADLM